MEYDVIVIGAGVAGLVATLKLSRKAKRVLLLEQQSVPGGYATTFKRKGFVFESSIHCVDELGEGGEIRDFLKEMKLENKIELIKLKNFARVIYPEHDFILNFKIGDFIKFLKESFPQESKNIDKFFLDINKFYKQFDSFWASGIAFIFKILLMPLLYPQIIKLSNCTIADFLNNYFKDEKIKAIITNFWFFIGLPPSRISAFYFLLVFRGYYFMPTCYVKGGFMNLFQVMVEQIKKTRSDVKFNTKVVKIISGKKIKTVITEKQEEFKTKVIISGANPIDTLTKFIDDNKIKEKYIKKFSSLEKSSSAVQVYLGLDIPTRQLGMNEYMFSIANSYNHDQAFESFFNADYDNCFIELVDHSQVDPTLVPEAKGMLLIMVLDSYKNWQNLTKVEYDFKKQEVAKKLIMRAEKYLPGLSRHVEVMEVATPLTMERFTASPEGAIYGLASSVRQSGINRLPQETDIKGLFLAGAWTRPGHGVHGCLISGMTAADLALSFL